MSRNKSRLLLEALGEQQFTGKSRTNLRCPECNKPIWAWFYDWPEFGFSPVDYQCWGGSHEFYDFDLENLFTQEELDDMYDWST